MAFSLKKRGASKIHIVANGNDDSKILGEVLHQSTKTKYKKNKTYQSLGSPKVVTPSFDLPPTSPIIYQTQCQCERHYDKQLLENSYQITVDKLFDLIFGSNEFVRTYHEAQRFYDESATEWLLNEATNQRERTLKYKVPYESTFFGKGTIFTREKQTLFYEVPASHYTLEAEVYNEGVRFSDTFTLIIRYCLVQTSSVTTKLRVTAHIIFNKSVSSVIKPLIERNAYSASQEGLKDLNNRLNLIENYNIEKRRLSRSETSVVSPSSPAPTEVIRRLSRDHSLPILPTISTTNDQRNNQPSNSDRLLYILIFLVVLLLILHFYLHTKLKRANLILDTLAQFLKI